MQSNVGRGNSFAYKYLFLYLKLQLNNIVWGSVTNNNSFWIGWLDLLARLLQLQSSITAHNQWLPKTRSIPYWTTSFFSSVVTDLVLIYESVTSSASTVRCLTIHSWTLNHNCNLTYFSSTNNWWILAYEWIMTGLWMPSHFSALLLLVCWHGNLCWFRWHGKRILYWVGFQESTPHRNVC
jgi:hypothetical protein